MPTVKINILLLITELNVGGAEKLVSLIARGINREKYHITVACLYDDKDLAEEIRESGIQVINLGMNSKINILAVWKLYRLILDRHIKVIHSHLYHANVIGIMTGLLARVPVIITTRQNVEIGGKSREIFNRALVRFIDRVVAVSDVVKQVEVDRGFISPEKVIVIENRIETSRYGTQNLIKVNQMRMDWSISKDQFTLCCIGRLESAKGHLYLFRALAENPDLFHKIRLLVVGDGGLRPELEYQSKNLGLEKKVLFVGLQQDIPEILEVIDIFVQPSLWEGLPLAVLEAMAAGKPVIASAVGGVPEVVIDGETGILVPPKNPDALADAINTLLSDPDLVQRMGEAGRRRAIEHFDISITIKETEALYDRLIEEKLGLVYQEEAGWVKVQ